MRSGAIAVLLSLHPLAAHAEIVAVSNSAALARVIEAARPGDEIVLAPGDYRLHNETTEIRRAGTAAQPIVMRAAKPGTAHIHSAVVELFKVFAPYWTFEGIDFVGNANTHHAFHVVAGADHTTFRNNRFRNFHAAIKGNPQGGKSPSFVTLEGNAVFNDAPRKTDEPVTAIDVVGGHGWVLRDNFIADFAKDGGDFTSYGAFLKGASTAGVFERNLVICEWHHTGGIRVGLSFGGGGTDAVYMKGARDEHAHGIMRNNVILNCPNAEGIYLNKASDSKIYNNTIYNAYGILVRFSSTDPSDVRNNIISGAIATRANGRIQSSNNVETGRSIGDYIPGAARALKLRISDYDKRWPSIFTPGRIAWMTRTIDGLAAWLGRSSLGRGIGAFDDWFVAPKEGDFARRDADRFLQTGTRVPEVEFDFCGRKRLGATDLGAIEYTTGPCDVPARIKALTAPVN